MFSCKFAASFQNTFSKEHLWTAASERYFNAKSSTYYFHIKMKIISDFQICISLPLNNKVAGLRVGKLIIETPTQVFAYEICGIFNNTYFEEHLRTIAFVISRIFNFSMAFRELWLNFF